MKVALYARVSKGSQYQNPENQLLALREWASREGVAVEGEYVDETSSRDARPQKEAILTKLRQRRIDGVAFYALDRWGRNMGELVLEIDEAKSKGWRLFSLKEGLDFNTAAGQLYAHMLAAFANFERERIRERTLAGLTRAKAQGKRLGRPPLPDGIKDQIMKLRHEGYSVREISRELGVSLGTVSRVGRSKNLPSSGYGKGA